MFFFPPPLPLFLYFLHHLQLIVRLLSRLQLTQAPLKVWVLRGGDEIEGESLNPGRVASLPDSSVKQQNTTGINRRS